MEKRGAAREKRGAAFCCNLCDYRTGREYNFNRHVLTACPQKRGAARSSEEQPEEKFYCNYCNYETIRADNYRRHITSIKHGKIVENMEKPRVIDDDFLKNLIIENMKMTANIVEQQGKQIEANNVLMTKMTDIVNHKTETNNMLNVTNTKTINNQRFNLNFFLNENCKDALNIDDFIESIKITLNDLEQTAQLGYIDGITKIINDKIRETGVKKRPYHCTDEKREIVYVKDNNVWEKEKPHKPRIKKMISTVINKNFEQLSEYKEDNPDCQDLTTIKGEEYLNMMIQVNGGNQQEREQKQDKIIKNILKEAVVEKNMDVL